MKRGRDWAKEEEKIRKFLFEDRLSVSQIASSYKVTRQRLWQVLVSYEIRGKDLPTPQKKSLPLECQTKEYWDEIKAKAGLRQNLFEYAKLSNLPYHRVRAFFKAAGYVLEPRVGTNSPHFKGGKYRISSGYIFLNMNILPPSFRALYPEKRTIAEHVYVVEHCLLGDKRVPRGWRIERVERDRGMNEENNLMILPTCMISLIHRMKSPLRENVLKQLRLPFLSLVRERVSHE